MHDILAVEVGDPLTNISKIFLNLIFRYCFHFDFVKECPSLSIFQHHIGDFSFRIDVNIKQLDDFGMRESVVHHDFVFGDFVNLG